MLKLTQSKVGMSLTEVMMGMAAIGGIMMVMLTLNEFQQKSIQGNRASISRDLLRASIERYSMDAKVIARSALHASGSNSAGNLALRYCLEGPSAPTPPQCTSGTACCREIAVNETPQPFLLIDPSDPLFQTILAGTEDVGPPLEDTEAAPARFSIDGAPCTTASSTCPIEAIINFSPTCDGPATQCNQASEIRVTYTVKQANGIKLPSNSMLKTITKSQVIDLAAAKAALNAQKGATGSSGPSGSAIPPDPYALQKVIIKSSGQFTVPSNVDRLYITLVGGGGGGGGSGKESSGKEGRQGAGGSSACTLLKAQLRVLPGEKYMLRIGGGGIAGVGSQGRGPCTYFTGCPGGAGQKSTFETSDGRILLSTTGGTPGTGGKGLTNGEVGVPGVAECNVTDLLESNIMGSRILSLGDLLVGNNGTNKSPSLGGEARIRKIEGVDDSYGKGGDGGERAIASGSSNSGKSGGNGIAIIEYAAE